MPYPFTKYRSRNRTRPNFRIPPLASSVGGPTSIDASSGIVTFPQPMDTTISAVPQGFTIDGNQVRTLVWASATTATVATDVALVAADPFVFPATNVLRGEGGGPVQAASGALVA
jgi:hypothetical protein